MTSEKCYETTQVGHGSSTGYIASAADTTNYRTWKTRTIGPYHNKLLIWYDFDVQLVCIVRSPVRSAVETPTSCATWRLPRPVNHMIMVYSSGEYGKRAAHAVYPRLYH